MRRVKSFQTAVKFGGEWFDVTGEYRPPWPASKWEPGEEAHVIVHAIERDGADVTFCLDAEVRETIASELALELRRG